MEFVERKRWLFLGLPFTFTKYTIKEDMITIDAGFLKTVENDCYMYKVQDVQHSASLAEKLFGLGTVTCFTGDYDPPAACAGAHQKFQGGKGLYSGGIRAGPVEETHGKYAGYRFRKHGRSG